ncbi:MULTISPECIES: hypothetical protein [Metabacillus]|uniref:Uncharacterized protein n=1 Tax=Metabacillus hrfriensis TaxID=3048891 RepID=A0ACD4RGU8_9BACI|nr:MULTISPECIES: hypothetical protein [Metabacillus]UAL53831.1 hypothetical protein K8L98_08690 [Metabacillus dongyingensis]USK30143.1 hypothetical protein LIT32_08590 [Bacillus sp. CMF21]WHZ59387.1 hypothetical protein QLQ22_08710 [Metabacillus sp. CT-WN-B3]
MAVFFLLLAVTKWLCRVKRASKQVNGAEKSSNSRKKCVKTGEWNRKIV